MSYTGDLMAGLAQRLEDGGVGSFDPTGGAYGPADTAIVLNAVPANPDRVVILTPYAAADDPTLSDSEVSLQVRVRGTRDPRTVYDLDDAAFDVLQNLPRSPLGGVVVTAAFRTSGSYLGVDDNQRHEHASNYRLLVHRPTQHRT